MNTLSLQLTVLVSRLPIEVSVDERKMAYKNKKGYLKIHVAVNVKTKKILSIKVTDERVHDSKALPDLVNDVIKLDKKITVGKLIDEYGAYEGNEIFRFIEDTNGIMPVLK